MATKGKKRLTVLITGGAGFMGRWTTKAFLQNGHRVFILDNLSNSSIENIRDFKSAIAGFVQGDIKNKILLKRLFKKYKFEICVHMASSINVQRSIDTPEDCFENNVTGTFNLLEECRKHKTKMVFVSSALVYASSLRSRAITEDHSLNPSCPYVVSKIFGENIVICYHRTYKLPVVILRPFSIYGPWQRSDSEGGVMSIFLERKLKGLPLLIYGSGQQSRDFFYVEDCADFILRAAISKKANGLILNAGSGEELRIIDLAKRIAKSMGKIKHVPHHHPHAEIMSMRSDSKKAKSLLGWKPITSLDEGIAKTERWLSDRIR